MFGELRVEVGEALRDRGKARFDLVIDALHFAADVAESFASNFASSFAKEASMASRTSRKVRSAITPIYRPIAPSSNIAVPGKPTAARVDNQERYNVGQLRTCSTQSRASTCAANRAARTCATAGRGSPSSSQVSSASGSS